MAETAKYYKTNSEGVEHMCKSMEDRIKAMAATTAIDIAIKMILKGKMTLEEIAECSNLSVDEVKTLAEKNKPVAT